MREHAHNTSPIYRKKNAIYTSKLQIKIVACVSEYDLKDHIVLQYSWKGKKIMFNKPFH